LRQYHQENAKVTAEFLLGEKMDQKVQVNIDSENPANSHLSVFLKNGTNCDLPTHKKPREVEIQIHCSDNIKEKFT
jgi:hypothetical protein